MASQRPGRRASSRTAASSLIRALQGGVEARIHEVRGQRVMLDADLAQFYGVETRVLNQAVRRNADRFPPDFAFQCTQTETELLRSQSVILENQPETGSPPDRRGRHLKYRPWAFTEHGALMAAAVLNSKRAVEMSVLVVRAFVRLRQILVNHEELARRLEKLEAEYVARTDAHETHLHKIYEILAELMNPPAPPPKRRIGFVSE